MKRDKATMNFQRRMLALMGFLLPLTTILGFIGGDRNAEDFWHSISAQYYATNRDFMVGTLYMFGCFLITYLGYDLGDKITNTFSALMAFGIILFPCSTSAAGPTTGLLNLPTPVSHVVHCICAAALFGSFAYNIGWRFTKSATKLTTEGKQIRNTIYKLCSRIIIGGMVLQVITSVVGIGWMTIVNETIMLWAFSFAWAVKSDTFKKYADNLS